MLVTLLQSVIQYYVLFRVPLIQNVGNIIFDVIVTPNMLAQFQTKLPENNSRENRLFLRYIWPLKSKRVEDFTLLFGFFGFFATLAYFLAFSSEIERTYSCEFHYESVVLTLKLVLRTIPMYNTIHQTQCHFWLKLLCVCSPYFQRPSSYRNFKLLWHRKLIRNVLKRTASLSNPTENMRKLFTVRCTL